MFSTKAQNDHSGKFFLFFNPQYRLIAARQGGFIVPYVREIVVRKNVANFEGCHFARFYILI